MRCLECDNDVEELEIHLMIEHDYSQWDAKEAYRYEEETAREEHPRMPRGGFNEP